MDMLKLKKALIRTRYEYRKQYTLWVLLYGSNNLENFFDYFPAKKIEYEKIVIFANELKTILTDYPDDLILKGEAYSIENILKKNPCYIKFLEKKEAMDYLTIDNIEYIEDIPGELFMQKIMKKAANHIPLSKKEYFRLSDDQFSVLWQDGSPILEEIPKKRWTKKLLDMALDALLEKKMSVSYGIKAPEELKTEKYWKVLCTVNGYYFRILPKQYKYILNEKFILNALEHNRSFIGYCHLLGSIPDQFKTHDVCLYACKNHFGAAAYLPKSLQNDVFYNELISEGMTGFVTEIDLKTISAKTFEKALMQYKKGPIFFKGKIPDMLCTQKIIKLLAFRGCIDNIPTKFKIRDFWLVYAQSPQVDLKKIPQKYIDEPMVLLAMKGNAFATRQQIPESVKTDRFFDVLTRYGLFYSPMDIPEKYWSKELIVKKAHSIDEIPNGFLSDETVIPILKKMKFISVVDIKRYQSKAVYDYVMESLENKSLYRYYLETFEKKYWNKKHLDYALAHDPLAILLPELSEEEIQISLHAFPDNIIYIAKAYLKSEKNNVNEKKNEKTSDTYQQITFFDLI